MMSLIKKNGRIMAKNGIKNYKADVHIEHIAFKHFWY